MQYFQQPLVFITLWSWGLELCICLVRMNSLERISVSLTKCICSRSLDQFRLKHRKPPSLSYILKSIIPWAQWISALIYQSITAVKGFLDCVISKHLWKKWPHLQLLILGITHDPYERLKMKVRYHVSDFENCITMDTKLLFSLKDRSKQVWVGNDLSSW